MPKTRVNPPVPSVREGNKTCDGTSQDYRRHSYRGEDPCAESRTAWAVAHRFYAHTGLYEEKDPETVHPFMYARPKKRSKNGEGSRIGAKNRSRSSKDPRNQ